MKNCCGICKIVGLLCAIGALNWGLYGIKGVDLVAKFLGVMTMPAKVVYIVIGIAGLVKLVGCFMPCPACKKA